MPPFKETDTMANQPIKLRTFHPPPRQKFIPQAIAAGAVLFFSGALAGATLAIPPPPTVERCNSAPDPIACLIELLD